MIRTCRLLFPVRNNYNVSVFNQRTSQPKQISVEFSFYTQQRKRKYLSREYCEKIGFSTFKEREVIELDRNQPRKSKGNVSSDYVTFKENKKAQKAANTLLNDSDQNVDIDFSAFKENLKSKSTAQEPDAKSKQNESINFLDLSENEKHIQPNAKVTNVVSLKKNYTAQSQEAIKMLKVMAKTKNRVPADLKYWSQILFRKEGSYKLFESCDVLYSMARLSFAPLPVLNFMAKNVIESLSKEEEMIPKILVSLLQSVCKLKYRNCELIESLCKKLTEIQHSLSTEQTTLCLFALSNVNMPSVYADQFINVLSKLKITDFNKTKHFLNYIWASVILEKENSLPIEHLEIVLSKAFSEQLTITGENTLLNKIKLSNINGVAADLKDYKGPLLENLFLSPVLSKSKNDFLTLVKDGLSYIFPKTGFTEALSYIGSGIFIDIECCVDSSSNPVLLKNKEKYNKIGIVLLDHSDFCLEDKEVTGVTAFKIKRIKNQGYKVLTISHTEFPINNALSLKIGFLRNKFKKVLPKSQ